MIMLMIMKRLTNTWLSLDNYYVSARSKTSFPGDNFINVLRAHFLYELSSFSLVTFGFVIFGAKILYVKWASKKLMKLTPRVNFTNILLEAFFLHRDPKSAKKRQSSHQCFCFFRICPFKSYLLNVGEIYPSGFTFHLNSFLLLRLWQASSIHTFLNSFFLFSFTYFPELFFWTTAREHFETTNTHPSFCLKIYLYFFLSFPQNNNTCYLT